MERIHKLFVLAIAADRPLTAPGRRALVVVALGLVTASAFGSFFLLPQARAAFPEGDGPAAVARFQLANDVGDLKGLFGDPPDAAVVAAVTAVTRLDLWIFIPIYAAFLVAGAFMLAGDRSSAHTRSPHWPAPERAG